MTKKEIMLEITPLAKQDCFYVVERIKNEFNFPIHTHKEFELNYIENAPNALRTVGDSIEEIGQYDLVLIANEQLEHIWQTGKCKSKKIREITIQFNSDLLSESLLAKNQFQSIQKMFEKAKFGISYPLSTVLRVRSLLNSIPQESNGFYSVINLFSLLYELSVSNEMRILASSSFIQMDQNIGSRRIKKVIEHIEMNYPNNIKINHVSEIVSMTPESFSRFFKQRTGKNFTEYLNDYRIGKVTRLLIDTTKNVSEICFECGFNNISNFNRIFQNKKGCTPSIFRETYRKKEIVI